MKVEKRVWTLEEEFILAKEYKKVPAKDLAKKLNRSVNQIYNKVSKLKEKGLIADEVFSTETELEEIKEGLDLSKLKLDKQKKYRIDIRKSEKGRYEEHLIGHIIQETKLLVTFETKIGYCESFLKADLLTGEYTIKEVKK